jgi:hypothetical protein
VYREARVIGVATGVDRPVAIKDAVNGLLRDGLKAMERKRNEEKESGVEITDDSVPRTPQYLSGSGIVVELEPDLHNQIWHENRVGRDLELGVTVSRVLLEGARARTEMVGEKGLI